MADQNESHRDDADVNLPEKPRAAEIVDAEVVESEVVTADPARPQQPADDEEFRQYQQFLEFQRFREWQQSQDGDVAVPPTATPPAAPPKKPWWKRALGLLRFKPVRWLIYLLLLLLLAKYLLDALSGDGSGGDGNGTGGGGVPPDSVPVKSQNPQQAVRSAYNWLRAEPPERTCELFDTSGKAAFAAAYQAPDCATAARQLHGRITDPNAYANPDFAENAVVEIGPEAQVLGCRMKVTGGPQLGTFKLTRQQDGGWAISAYALQTRSCGG